MLLHLKTRYQTETFVFLIRFSGVIYTSSSVQILFAVIAVLTQTSLTASFCTCGQFASSLLQF